MAANFASDVDAAESTRSFRFGGGSLPCRRSLPLPLPLEVVPPGTLLLLLPCRSRTGSSLGRFERSWPKKTSKLDDELSTGSERPSDQRRINLP